MGYTKSALLDAVVSALEPLTARGGGYLRELRHYAGGPGVEGLVMEALQLPAVFVLYASSAYGAGPCLHASETVSFNVVSVCRAGGAPDPFRVQEDVRDILSGSTLGLSVMPLRLLSESPLACARETTALCAVYSLVQAVKLPAQDKGGA